MGSNGSAKQGQPVIRAIRQGIKLRAAGDSGMPTLHGHFAVFNRFTEIDSWMEGNFMERIAPGAFKKTFREQTPKVLFQHGQDPQIGDKPLGPVEMLSEDSTGAAYEVPLLDTAYNRELIPGLEAGLYGASFRFSVVREEIDEEPEPSDDNPRGLAERTIKEARVMEFGPVTFPAYDDATAGVRSLTDRFLFDAIERDPTRARELMRAKEADLLRMDVEDLNTLAQMTQLAAKYIAEQDEPDDQANIPKMEAILGMISDLVPIEVAEDEEPEIDDQAGRSKKKPAAPSQSRRRPQGTSDTERREPSRLNDEEWASWLTSRPN
jgi:HK97 family phage prohead protease